MKHDDPLDDFTRRDIVLDEIAKGVYVAGTGPAVIVMAEMPGRAADQHQDFHRGSPPSKSGGSGNALMVTH